MKRTLIFGYGYLGRRVALLSRNAGDCVIATTRNSGKSDAIAAAGLTPLVCDWTDRPGLMRSISGLGPLDRVLVAVAYDRHSGIDRNAAMVGGLANLLDALQRSRNGSACRTSLCYISTTGVYHQTGGVWVDERSATRPTRDGGKAHLRAEALLRNYVAKHPGNAAQVAEAHSGVIGSADGIVHRTLRLSGIYGPGRVPRAADVRAGRPIASPPHGYLNLIHVDDAASAVMAAWDLPHDQHAGFPDRQTYLVSDDQPVVRRDFYQRIADHYGVVEPRFCDPAEDSSVRFRSETNKRVWNRKMKRELNVSLRFPTFREGLLDVLDR